MSPPFDERKARMILDHMEKLDLDNYSQWEECHNLRYVLGGMLPAALGRIEELEADALKKAALLDGVMCNCNQLRSRAQKAEDRCKDLVSENERLAKMFVTAEQRTALEKVDALLWKHLQEEDVSEIGRILYEMRTESSPAWQITEERKEALRFGVAVLGGIKSTHRTELLTMLAEAEGRP